MAHIIQAIAVDIMGWLRDPGLVDPPTYVASPPGGGTVSVMDAIAPSPKPMLSPSWGASARTEIWDNKTLTAGVVLGLVIVLSIGYARSPWRKLPPSPPRLPILGNALQLRDKSWLLSKDCKQRFGEFPTI